MTLLSILDIGLGAIVLGVAAWTVLTRDTFAAVVGFVVYGLLVSIVWVRLYAPDVALTEAAIGSGVTGVLLITAGTRLAGNRTETERGLSIKTPAALLALLTTAALAAAVLLLPDNAPSLAPAADKGLAATGLGNPVTAVLIAYRSFDTMLEKIVLVLAVVGVWSTAPDRSWGGAPASLGRSSPQGDLLLLAKVLTPIGILVGLHMFWAGADEPGGAFQSGAILAAMWIVVMMARMAEPPRIAARWLRLTLVAGPAVFLAVGLLGPWMAGAFFAYPVSVAKPIIIVIEAFMVLTIAATLPMLVAGPPSRNSEP